MCQNSGNVVTAVFIVLHSCFYTSLTSSFSCSSTVKIEAVCKNTSISGQEQETQLCVHFAVHNQFILSTASTSPLNG